LTRRTGITICMVLAITIASYAGSKNRSVVLPQQEARNVAQICSRQGPPKFGTTWQPTATDVRAMESHLSRISRLQSKSGLLGVRVHHPDSYYRQYLGIVIGTRQLIYINAFCAEKPPADWRTRLVNNCDGGCDWGVIYDAATGEFSDLEMNGIG